MAAGMPGRGAEGVLSFPRSSLEASCWSGCRSPDFVIREGRCLREPKSRFSSVLSLRIYPWACRQNLFLIWPWTERPVSPPARFPHKIPSQENSPCPKHAKQMRHLVLSPSQRHTTTVRDCRAESGTSDLSLLICHTRFATLDLSRLTPTHRLFSMLCS